MPNTSITLYGLPMSGHCHRVELMLRMLKLEFHYEEVSRTDFSSPAFLGLNPLGQVPVLKDNNLVLADSNAILVYLATTYDAARVWYPNVPAIAVQIQRWLSIAAGELRFGPAMARAIRLSVRSGDIGAAQMIAERLMTFMNAHLAERNFLSDGSPTIADLACYFLYCGRAGRRHLLGALFAYSRVARAHRGAAGVYAYASLTPAHLMEAARAIEVPRQGDRYGGNSKI